MTRFVLVCVGLEGFLLLGLKVAGTAWSIPVALFAVAIGLAVAMEEIA